MFIMKQTRPSALKEGHKKHCMAFTDEEMNLYQNWDAATGSETS